MKNYDATRTDGAPLNCIQCDREIPGGNWFARMKLGEGRVAACCPGCVEKFLENRPACAAKIGVVSPAPAESFNRE